MKVAVPPFPLLNTLQAVGTLMLHTGVWNRRMERRYQIIPARVGSFLPVRNVKRYKYMTFRI